MITVSKGNIFGAENFEYFIKLFNNTLTNKFSNEFFTKQKQIEDLLSLLDKYIPSPFVRNMNLLLSFYPTKFASAFFNSKIFERALYYCLSNGSVIKFILSLENLSKKDINIIIAKVWDKIKMHRNSTNTKLFNEILEGLFKRYFEATEEFYNKEIYLKIINLIDKSPNSKDLSYLISLLSCFISYFIKEKENQKYHQKFVEILHQQKLQFNRIIKKLFDQNTTQILFEAVCNFITVLFTIDSVFQKQVIEISKDKFIEKINVNNQLSGVAFINDISFLLHQKNKTEDAFSILLESISSLKKPIFEALDYLSVQLGMIITNDNCDEVDEVFRNVYENNTSILFFTFGVQRLILMFSDDSIKFWAKKCEKEIKNNIKKPYKQRNINPIKNSLEFLLKVKKTKNLNVNVKKNEFDDFVKYCDKSGEISAKDLVNLVNILCDEENEK